LSREEIIDRLMRVLHNVFDDDDIAYRDTLTAADVEEWDSLSDIRLMVATEKAFGTRFSSAEWEGLTQLGDLVSLLEKRE
jgi:acyl carrier protein